MKFRYQHALWIVVVLALAGCGLAQTQQNEHTPSSATPTAAPLPTQSSTALPREDVSDLPALAQLAPGWNQLDPQGATTCAYGDPYHFFVRKAETNKLLIYFEGGGSCYDAKTCRVNGEYFDGSIDPGVAADNPALKTYGIFHFDDARNPFRDYNVVFVSYCTGDGYMGNRTVTYNDGGYEYPIHHVGFTNALSVLEWTYQNFPQPGNLFVIGCSAGVSGAYLHGPFIFEHYPGLTAALVGDSGGAYVAESPSDLLKNYGLQDVLPDWISAYQTLLAEKTVDWPVFFRTPVLNYPHVRFGMVNTLSDGVQNAVIKRFNPLASLPRVLSENMAAIQEGTSNFSSYLGAGEDHCITMAPAYYEMQVKGVGLNDWFTQLAAGQSPPSVAP